jgi:hypothetical protein
MPKNSGSAATTFEVRSSRPVEVGADGEALALDPPSRFRATPGALRYDSQPMLPATHPPPGPTKGWATTTALLQTAAGHPLAIEP